MEVGAFDRAQVNKMIDFAFAIEGRYTSFWSSFLLPVFTPVLNSEQVFPDMLGLNKIFGTDPDTGEARKEFYALNWGQKEFWSKGTRILAIYANGYRDCYWTYVTGINNVTDPRIIEVQIAHELPELYIDDVNVITEYVYMRTKSDNMEFNFSTTEIVSIPFPFQEDLKGNYNPWNDFPPNFPDTDDLPSEE
jgi:hypothetical protein